MDTSELQKQLEQLADTINNSTKEAIDNAIKPLQEKIEELKVEVEILRNISSTKIL